MTNEQRREEIIDFCRERMKEACEREPDRERDHAEAAERERSVRERIRSALDAERNYWQHRTARIHKAYSRVVAERDNMRRHLSNLLAAIHGSTRREEQVGTDQAMAEAIVRVKEWDADADTTLTGSVKAVATDQPTPPDPLERVARALNAACEYPWDNWRRALKVATRELRGEEHKG